MSGYTAKRNWPKYERVRQLRREGKTLKSIGVEMDVCAERIRQMLATLRRADENEARNVG